MPLVNLDITADGISLPEEVASYLLEAEDRIERFESRRRNNPVSGFVPSDFPLVYQMLQTIRNIHLAAGNRFCEWGCGLGVVASLASMLGFEAYGIEIDEELVSDACQLAEDFAVDVQFIRGSFIPEGGDALADNVGDFHWLVTSGESAYNELGLEPDDFDVVFAYPWPGEEEVILRLFERYAAAGSILLTYHGVEELRVRRKTMRRR